MRFSACIIWYGYIPYHDGAEIIDMGSKIQRHRTAKGAARIQALTDAAGDLFLDQGYEAVSLDALIARVGGSRRNIYQYFGGKEGLFIEVVAQLCEELAQPLSTLQIDDKDANDALAELGNNILRVILQPRALSLHRLMIAEGERFPELSRAIWRAGHANAITILATWIDRRQPLAFRRDISSEALAEQFINLVAAAAQLRALIGLPVPGGIVENAVETFLYSAVQKDKAVDE